MLTFFTFLVAFAFLSAPLSAICFVLGGRKRWRKLQIALPLIYAGIGIGVLCLSASARQLYLLPFVLPLALLAVEGVGRVPSAWHTAGDWVNRCIFSLAALWIWAIWWTMRQPVQRHTWLIWLERWLPLDYTLHNQPRALAAAALLTAAWPLALKTFGAQREWRGVFSWG